MVVLTDEQLQQIATSTHVTQRPYVIICGNVRCCLTQKQRLFFHRSFRKMFAVLNNTYLACYESESDWCRDQSASCQILLSSIVSIECSPSSILIGYTSYRNQQVLSLRLTCDNRDRLSKWQALLQANLPGQRSIHNFASILQLPATASVREIVNCISMAFPKQQTKDRGCFHPNCDFSAGPRTKYCPFHKRIHADRQFRLQISNIRRLIVDCRMDLEQAVVGIIADQNNDEIVRRDAIQLLWDICCCIPLGSFQASLLSVDSERGGLKFMNHLSLLSSRQKPDDIVTEGILDVLLQRTANDLGDCRVKRPCAWPALLAMLAGIPADHRQRLLHKINFLLIDNEHNCSTLARQAEWQRFVYSGLISERTGADMIVALSLNILVTMSYDALMNTNSFLSTVNETLVQVQQCGAMDQTSLEIARAYLICLCNKISVKMKFFPIDISSRPWIQSILLSNVVLLFLFRTSDWGQKDQVRRHRKLSVNPKLLPLTNLTNRFRHPKHFVSVGVSTNKFPSEAKTGMHQGDLDGDLLLAQRIISLHDGIVNVIRDPMTLMDENRDPFVLKDAESIIVRFRQIANGLCDKSNNERALQNLIKKPLPLYH